MIQNNNIVTAPRVPSSPSVNYYDPRGHPFYAHQQSAPVHNNHYLNTSAPLHSTVNSTAAVAAAAAAAAAAVGVDLNTSLPPLSRLLPPTANDSRTVRSQGVYKTPPLGHRFDDVYMVHQHLPYNDVFHPPSVRSHQLPSPPTSVIDSVMMSGDALTNHHQKVFSFVPLPGVQQKKRPRRKYHEVERLYKCNYQNCTKAYGTLNHLNAHVSMQKHGPKRLPAEFKELRKMWRKQKRENKREKQRDNKDDEYNSFLPHWSPDKPTTFRTNYGFMPQY